jgi:hypothetical protein
MRRRGAGRERGGKRVEELCGEEVVGKGGCQAILLAML